MCEVALKETREMQLVRRIIDFQTLLSKVHMPEVWTFSKTRHGGNAKEIGLSAEDLQLGSLLLCAGSSIQ